MTPKKERGHIERDTAALRGSQASVNRAPHANALSLPRSTFIKTRGSTSVVKNASGVEFLCSVSISMNHIQWSVNFTSYRIYPFDIDFRWILKLPIHIHSEKHLLPNLWH